MDESGILTDFRNKFQVDELLIARNTAWSWSVRPAQATLGCGVLSLNRYAARFSDLTPAEMLDMGALIARLEPTLQTVFGYDILNYLMLMMVDHHVHLHVIPRYQAARQFAGMDWVDNGWPAFPVLADRQHSQDAEVLRRMRDELRSAYAA